MAKTGPKPTPASERFWKFVDKEPGRNGCWVWTGASGNGYGRITVDAKTRLSTRVSWEMNFGPIPDGLGVLHRCDNPPCIRPDHLFLGTQADNLQDAAKKKRLPRFKANLPFGENHYKAILTTQQIAEILASNDSAPALAKRYGISRGSIYAVRSGKGWTRAIAEQVANA